MEPGTAPSGSSATTSADTIEITLLHDETMMFAIRNGRGQCLSKSGQWVSEPLNRTAQFIAQCRFDDYRQAADELAKFMSQPLTFEQLEEMANVLTNLADDLLESGMEEWESIDQAMQSTTDNLRNNLSTELIGKPVPSSIFCKK